MALPVLAHFENAMAMATPAGMQLSGGTPSRSKILSLAHQKLARLTLRLGSTRTQFQGSGKRFSMTSAPQLSVASVAGTANGDSGDIRCSCKDGRGMNPMKSQAIEVIKIWFCPKLCKEVSAPIWCRDSPNLDLQVQFDGSVLVISLWGRPLIRFF